MQMDAKEAETNASGSTAMPEVSAGHVSSTDKEALSRFHCQTTNLLNGVASKLLAEADLLHLDITRNYNIALRQEKERHLKEEQRILEGVAQLQSSLSAMELEFKREECIAERLVSQLQKQSDLTLTSRYFHAWKDELRNAKRERSLCSIADKHYCTKLKVKVFHAWFGQLKITWKQRLEIKANMEVLESQRYIVNTYESKIQNLQQNLSEAGRKISSLHRSYEETVRKSLSIENQAFNNNLLKQTDEDTLMDSASASSSRCVNCDTCTAHSLYKNIPVNYVIHHVEKLSEPTKIHPAALPKSLPVMGTASYTHFSKAQKGNDDYSHTLKPMSLVERHVPRTKTSSSSRPSSGKVHSHKKIV